MVFPKYPPSTEYWPSYIHHADLGAQSFSLRANTQPGTLQTSQSMGLGCRSDMQLACSPSMNPLSSSLSTSGRGHYYVVRSIVACKYSWEEGVPCRPARVRHLTSYAASGMIWQEWGPQRHAVARQGSKVAPHDASRLIGTSGYQLGTSTAELLVYRMATKSLEGQGVVTLSIFPKWAHSTLLLLRVRTGDPGVGGPWSGRADRRSKNV